MSAKRGNLCDIRIVARAIKHYLHDVLTQPSLCRVPNRRVVHRDNNGDPVQPHSIPVNACLRQMQGVDQVIALKQSSVVKHKLHGVDVVEEYVAMRLALELL